MRIGPYTLASNLCLSPLAGYTNLPMRQTIRELGGLGWTTTDLINARSLLERSPAALRRPRYWRQAYCRPIHRRRASRTAVQPGLIAIRRRLDTDRSRLRPQKTVNHLQQTGLTRTICADEHGTTL